MNYSEFLCVWTEALRKEGLLTWNDQPEETLGLAGMERRYSVRVGMFSGGPSPEPFTALMELKWEWDALKSARTRTTEEDALGMLLGQEGVQDVATVQPWLRVDIALAGKLPLGSLFALPPAKTWRAWAIEAARLVDPLLPSGKKPMASGALTIDSWRSEPTAKVKCDANGELWLLGVELAAWQKLDLPRQWDDPEREPDETLQQQLEAFAQRLREVLQAWKVCLKALLPAPQPSASLH